MIGRAERWDRAHPLHPPYGVIAACVLKGIASIVARRVLVAGAVGYVVAGVMGAWS